MTDVEAVLLDTSVLLEASDEKRSQSQEAVDLIETRTELVFPAQVVREYLVVATRPVHVNGLGLSLEQALENLREVRRTIRLLPEEKPLLPALLRLLSEAPVGGKRIHDAHIVAAAVVHGVRKIVTLNSHDFEPFSAHVSTMTPRAALASRSR